MILFYQFLLIGITALVALGLVYMFFDMNFMYFLYFEILFLLLFIGFGLIEAYWLSIVIFLLSLIIYQAIAPRLSREDKD